MTAPSDVLRPTAPAALLATWFGTGLLPFAPGSFGALSALPLAWLLVAWGGSALLLLAAAAIFAVGLWASARYMAAHGVHDPNAVVIDEVVGQWLTLALVPLDPLVYGLGFLLFRIFDVIKPWPVNWIDRRVGGAFGVMIDDVAAAVYAGLVLWLVARWVP